MQHVAGLQQPFPCSLAMSPDLICTSAVYMHVQSAGSVNSTVCSASGHPFAACLGLHLPRCLWQLICDIATQALVMMLGTMVLPMRIAAS